MKRAPSVCSEPACPWLAVYRGKCADHRPKQSPSGSRRVRGRKRAAILKPDARCFWCGAPADQVDHLEPVSQGGTSAPSNLLAACTPCNASRGGTLSRGAREDTPRGPTRTDPSALGPDIAWGVAGGARDRGAGGVR